MLGVCLLPRLQSSGTLEPATDDQRPLRCRSGQWSVAEQQAGSTAAPAASAMGSHTPLFENNVGYYPGDALEEVRARLERCLLLQADMD